VGSDDAARIIEAIGSLLWPLLVAVLLIRILPHVPGRGRRPAPGPADPRLHGQGSPASELTWRRRPSSSAARSPTSRPTWPSNSPTVPRGWRGREGPQPTSPGAGPARDQAPGPCRPGACRPSCGSTTTPDDSTLELAKLRDDGVECCWHRSTARGHGRPVAAPGRRRHRHRLGRAEDGEFPVHARPGPAAPAARGRAGPSRCSSTPAPAGSSSTARTPLTPAPALVTSSPTELFAALRRILATGPGPGTQATGRRCRMARRAPPAAGSGPG
jgi:hypothetical protein